MGSIWERFDLGADMGLNVDLFLVSFLYLCASVSLALSPLLRLSFPLSPFLCLPCSVSLSLAPLLYLSFSLSPFLCLSSAVSLALYLLLCLALSLSFAASLLPIEFSPYLLSFHLCLARFFSRLLCHTPLLLFPKLIYFHALPVHTPAQVYLGGAFRLDETLIFGSWGVPRR